MHPKDPKAYLDAVVLSVHKFIGGPQASGILVAHRDLFRTKTPERPGGGTVDYVGACDRHSVDYVQRLDEREEGGTPAIVSDLRAGIAFLVREMLGPARILEHETALAAQAIKRLSQHPRIRLLGPLDVPRLPVLSFNVEGLHHDLVSALLDHLFGIQNRAGCSCAGPYGHRLLGIGEERSQQYRKQIARGLIGLKPGWVRLSLPPYASSEDVEFILSAVEFVADNGRHFVPSYCLDWRNGVWRHLEKPVPDVRPLELTVQALEESAQTFAAGDHEGAFSDAQIEAERARYFVEARRAANELRERWTRDPPRWNVPLGQPEVDPLIWFDYVHTTFFT
jgi:hypothetical protein